MERTEVYTIEVTFVGGSPKDIPKAIKDKLWADDVVITKHQIFDLERSYTREEIASAYKNCIQLFPCRYCPMKAEFRCKDKLAKALKDLGK